MSRIAAQRSTACFDASVVPAKPGAFPGFIEPCHPTLREEAPSGAHCVHEIKFDGYRTQAHLQEGQPAIYTRAGHDWTRRFQTIADALAALPAKDLILDGEAVVADSRGVPRFGLLHADVAAGRKELLVVLTLITINIALAVLQRYWPPIGKVFNGVPMVIVEEGRPLRELMERARVEDEDVLEAARRLQGLERMDQIKYAVLEKSGGIFNIPKE